MTHATLPARSVPAPDALPKPIQRVLGRLNRRLRASAALRGLGLVALLLAFGAAAGMAADFALALPRAARWALWGAWLTGATWAFLVRVIGHVVWRPAPFDLAAVAERGQPELGERLTGAVSLLGASVHGSPTLIAAAAHDAAARAERVDPRRAVPLATAVRRLVRGLGALGLVAAPALVSPPYRALGERFLAPWADIEHVGRWIISVAPGDQVVAIGSDLALSAEVRPRFGRAEAPEVAWLEWTDAKTRESHRVAMPAKDESASTTRAFAVTLPRVPGSFTYRVVSGSAESRRFTVTALEPPAVAALTARVEPPAYTKMVAETFTNPTRIEAWEGSRVVLDLTASTAVRSAGVGWPADQGGKKEHELALTPDRRSGTVAVSADEPGTFAFTLHDEHGLASRPETPRRLIVRPDAPPVVVAKGPAGAKESRPDDTLRVAVAARDDVAVASVELHYAIERSKSKPESGQVNAPLAGLGTKAAKGAASLELKSLGLKPGDAITYRVRVADNRPAPRGPNVVWSNEESLEIVANADPMLARQSAAKRAELQAKLDELKKAAAENRKEAEQLRYSADAAQRGNGEWDRERQQALSERESEARAVADRLQLLARDFQAEPEFQALARPARQIAEVEAEAARAVLDRAKRADDAEQRLDDLRQADARLGAVVGRLDELQQQFDALSKRDAERERLAALARREADLARRAEAMQDGADRARLDQLQAEQNAVRNELDELVRKSPELKTELLAAQARDADELAKRARALAERQREEARQATDLTKQADKLKGLADEQRAIEDEARRLALDVDNALSENHRGRLNTQAVREPVVPLERGAMDEARQRLEGAENELRRLARDIEDVPTDPKALARRLVQRQDQLNGQIAEASAEARGKNELTAEEKTALTRALKPLADRQEEIARLAKVLAEAKPSDPHHPVPGDLFETARQSTAKAAEGLRDPSRPRDIEHRQHEARQFLARLADTLPDPWKRQEAARPKLDEARRHTHEVASELERHLRETAPQPGQPYDPAKGAAELAQRLGSVAQKQARAAEVLAALEPDSRAVPQRDRAARRARQLAEALDAAQKQGGQPNESAAMRPRLAALQVEARAAFDRLEQKMNQQVPADDVAAELAAEQRRWLGKLDRPEDRADAAADQRRLSTALRNLNAPDAALEQAEAVRLADRAAQALADPAASESNTAKAVQQAKDAAEVLAGRLADEDAPRARAAALSRAQRALGEPDAQADPAAATQRQKAIADAVSRLPLDGKQSAIEKARRAAEMAEHARNTEAHMPSAAPPTAAALAQAREQAAQALDDLAAHAPADPAPKTAPARSRDWPDPALSLKPAQVEQARALARRERQLRERLQALLGERVAPQQEIRRESATLGRELTGLRDRARGVSDRAQGPAHEAAQLLGEHAPRAMDQGSDHLAQGQPHPARDHQRRAAELVERGAQQAEDLAAALRADRPADAQQAQGQGQGQGDSPAQLGAAREALQRAQNEINQAREPGQAAAAMRAAGQAMRQAAEQLRAAAQPRPGQGEGQAGQDDPSLAANSPAQPGTPKGQTKDPHSGPGGSAAPDLAQLQDMIRSKTGRAWGELPGHLRTEILQMSQSRYRDDYARLIQLYYREIAAGAEREARP